MIEQTNKNIENDDQQTARLMKIKKERKKIILNNHRLRSVALWLLRMILYH